MNQVTDLRTLLTGITTLSAGEIPPVSVSSTDDPYADEREIIEIQNRSEGDLVGYDCRDCLNRGFYWRMDEHGNVFTRECRCMALRRQDERIEASGLGDMANRYTFEHWESRESWQEAARKQALSYIRRGRGWMLVSGRTGAGKTHLCAATLRLLLEQGRHGRYLLWRDEVRRMKALVTEASAYAAAIEPLKRADVLYIDDLFKGRVTDGDLNVAYELINARYNDSHKLTIISTECSQGQLRKIDEAIYGRIVERCREGCAIDLSGRANWRLKEVTS